MIPRSSSSSTDHQGRDGGAPKREFASVGDILERSPAMRAIREYERTASLREAWEESVGPLAARNSRVTRYAGGTLHVDVFSAPMLQELSSYRKKEIMARLRRTDKFKGLIDIAFRAG